MNDPAGVARGQHRSSSATCPAKAFTYATDALRTGLIPADLRAALPRKRGLAAALVWPGP